MREHLTIARSLAWWLAFALFVLFFAISLLHQLTPWGWLDATQAWVMDSFLVGLSIGLLVDRPG